MKTTGQVENIPWAPAQPVIEDILGEAGDLYESGIGQQWPTFDTYVGMGAGSQDALAQLRAMAGQPSALGGAATSAVSGILGNPVGQGQASTDALTRIRQMVSGGTPGIDAASGAVGGILSNPLAMSGNTNAALTQIRNLANQGVPGLNQALGVTQGILSGQGLGDNSQFDAIYNRGMGPTAGSAYLEDIAGGTAGNPFLNTLLDQGANRITNSNRAVYAAKGRYGSADQTEALGRAIAEYQTPLQFSAYEADQGRRLQAAGLLDSSSLAALNTALSAAGAGANANIARAGTQLSAAGMIPGLDAARYGGAERLLTAGAYQDQFGQQNRANTLQAAGLMPLLDEARYSGVDRLAGLGAQQDQFKLQSQQQQLGAAQTAASLDQNRYADIDRLMAAGQYEDADAQAARDAEVQKWFFEHGGAQGDALSQYAQLVAALTGGYGTETAKEPRQPLLTLLGALSGGLGILGR